MLKKVQVKMVTERVGIKESLFESILLGEYPDEEEYARMMQSITPEDDTQEPMRMELHTEARLRLTDEWYSVSYEETELSGMAGSSTQLSFHRGDTGLINMIRAGSVRTALVFEAGKRHICTYETPFAPFETGVLTRKVDNRLLSDGILQLDYIVEIRGAQAEHCKITFEVFDNGKKE